MEINANFSESLKGLIITKRITPTILANAINVSKATISRWQSGKTEPTLNNLFLLAKYFKCSLNFLVGITDNYVEVIHYKETNFYVALKKLMVEKRCSTYYFRNKTTFGSHQFSSWSLNTSPTLSTLIELVKIFDCTLDEIAGIE